MVGNPLYKKTDQGPFVTYWDPEAMKAEIKRPLQESGPPTVLYEQALLRAYSVAGLSLYDIMIQHRKEEN